MLTAFFGCAVPEATKPGASAPAEPPVAAPRPEASVSLAPRPIAVPKPPPLPEPAGQSVAKRNSVAIESTILFEYRKSELTPDAKAKLDREIVARLPEFDRLDSVSVSGHADRIASHLHNVKLSRARAQAIKAYLVQNGASASKISVFGFGKTQPVKSCPEQADRQRLIECLAPNRRVVIEVKGSLR
jgi:OOP family OmpA-OmpF porin